MGAATMAEEADEEFETGDSGASLTYPMQAGELRKGSHVMIKGHPCKVAEISTSKTGKHGHAKAHIVALDIFTGKKYEDLCPTSHNVSVPIVTRSEYQLLTMDDSGAVTLLDTEGNTREDLNSPTKVKTGEPTDDDKKHADEMLDGLDGGKDVFVTVLKACGDEKIIATRCTET